MRNPSNKLSIYLIKEEYRDHKDILQNIGDLKSVQVKDIGIFYYKMSFDYKPPWVDKFFGNTIPEDIELFNASTKALFLVEIEYERRRRIFAVSFGYGWQYLNLGVYEERFGLKTALNIIDLDKLKKIDKKNMSLAPKDTREQLTKSGGIADFGLDIEQDLVRAVTGNSRGVQFGKIVSGKDSLSLTVPIGVVTIKDFLAHCLERFMSDDYKKDFGWVDQIAEIRDPKTLTELNGRLIENFKKKDLDSTWMAVPEIIEWEHISGFKYLGQSENNLHDDLSLLDFLEMIPHEDKESLDVEFLKKKLVYAISSENDQVRHKWSSYSCIYSELSGVAKNLIYLLSNGKWYEVATNFAEEINNSFDGYRKAGIGIDLPDCRQENEEIYNDRIARELGQCLMDKKMIIYGGGYSKIEFCDIYTKDRKIMHIKHYGGSSVLNHLFAQGLVSGELFLRDKTFRSRLNESLGPEYKLSDVVAKPTASSYEVVFAIISSSPKELEIPFFSKVSLKNAINRLETFGYRVHLVKIFNKISN